MSRPSFVRAIAALCAIPTVATAQQITSYPVDRYVGYWVGVLAVPAAQLHLALTVTRESSGSLGAVMTSIDQNNAKVPGIAALHGDTLVVDMPGSRASFRGVITDHGDSLRGTFTQGVPLPLTLGRATAPAPPERPQEPRPPFPYDAREVSFESVPAVRLSGTLITPRGTGPFPTVVFVTGSGPQNRDEELLGHKPFLVIADHLARHGIASLRYDDRGIAKSTGNFATATTADFANDAAAAVRWVRTQPGVAADHVGIIGHSEGGLIAPIVATRSKDVAFIVLLSGPGLPGDSILMLQTQRIAAADGTSPELVARNAQVNRRLYDAVMGARDSADAAARLLDASSRMVATLPPQAQALGASQLASARAQLINPWMRYFLSFDPRPVLRQVHVPVLALGGTNDLQVPYRENLAAIDTALRAAGNRDYEIVALPRLNHLFQTSTTGSPSEYEKITETVSPAALDTITSWITAHATKKP